MTEYLGWKTKQTWLVNIWYMDAMPEYFADTDQYHVSRDELEETVKYIAEESEALSHLGSGLLSDFITDSWYEVDWKTLADNLNETLKEMQEE